MARFRDRGQAGRELARLVEERGAGDDPVVLALPRGGVPVALEITRQLGAPLDVLVVRKLRTPRHRELAFGAVASGGVRWINPDVPVPREVAERLAVVETEAVRVLEQRYRPPGFVSPPIEGRTALIVDDGIATGATMSAAIQAARLRKAAAVIVAAPIAPPDVVRNLPADRVDVVETRRAFGAVSVLYDDFSEVPDSAVAAMLSSASSGRSPSSD